MQLKELLKQEMLKNAVVVAGDDGITNQVTSVNMMDAPDITDYVKKDQLLITTGYNIRHEPEILADIVREMAEKGCAGLALKTHRFLKAIPDSVIETAEACQFPIIELPMQPSLGEIVHHVLGVILQESTEALTEAMAIHRRFTDLIVSGKGLFEVVDQLAKHIHAPVLLLDHRLHLLETSKKLDEPFYYDLALALSEQIEQAEPGHTDIQKLNIRFPNEERVRRVSCFPVQMNVYQKGYLVVFLDMEEAAPSERLAVEQAMNVIAFELMKLHAVEQQTRIQKNDFLTEFVEGHYTSEKDLARRGESYGLQRNRTYLCTVLKLDNEEELYDGGVAASEDERRLYRNSIFEQLHMWFDYYFDEVVFFSKGDLFVSLIPKPEDEPDNWLQNGLEQIQNEMEEFLMLSVSIGIGNPAAQLLQVPESYQEALETLQSGYRMEQRRFIKWTDTKGVTELLRTVSPQKLREFYQATLKSLSIAEKKEDEDLIETLTLYIEHNGQIADTAKALFVHRNTVIYRLKKCEEKLQVNLKNAEDIHKLRTALLVKSMID